jgi:hypothetical protein
METKVVIHDGKLIRVLKEPKIDGWRAYYTIWSPYFGAVVNVKECEDYDMNQHKEVMNLCLSENISLVESVRIIKSSKSNVYYSLEE